MLLPWSRCDVHANLSLLKISMPGIQLQCKWLYVLVLVLMSPCLCSWRFACLDVTARCLQVDYSLELGPPIVTLQDARKQNSYHKLPVLPGPNTNLPSGEKSAIPHVQKCPMQIRGAKWHIPTQARSCFTYASLVLQSPRSHHHLQRGSTSFAEFLY